MTALIKIPDTGCSDRYVTLVNPVRGRDLWYDKSTTPLLDQYQEIKKRGFNSTWLIQYDALLDGEIVDNLNSFGSNHEKGLFLEVSRNLSEKAKVYYDESVSWFSPKMIFLSAYTPKQREDLIDEMMRMFKIKIGAYPKSVGAWWIDSYSLKYLKESYGIESALIVADQKSTDYYGVWGQWWGYPYIASRQNILTSANNANNSSGVLIIQWAQRDPVKGYGDEGNLSLYSLQANDYLKLGLSTNYFSSLASKYLSCNNQIGQITLGLETGKESIEAWPEYINQLNVVKNTPGLKTVTMNEFSKIYKSKVPKKISIGEKGKNWILNTDGRENLFLNEKITYRENIAFNDYFIADKSHFLRRYQADLEKLKSTNWFNWWILVLPFIYLYLQKRKERNVYFPFVLYLISSFGVVLFSYYKYGWQVFFLSQGITNLVYWQVMITILSFIVYYLFGTRLFEKEKIRIVFFYTASLVYGMDFILGQIRYSFLSGVYYLGIFVKRNIFFGLDVDINNSIYNLKNISFPINQANAFIKIPFEKINSNWIVWGFLYPIFHLLLGYIIVRILMRLNRKIIILLILFLSLFFVGYLCHLLSTEPQTVLPLYKN